jgi:adenosine kinase
LSSEVAPLVESVKFYYMDGYFLTHGLESALYLSRKSATAGKVISLCSNNKILRRLTLTQTFVVNLSAPFIPQFFTRQLQDILPYTDIIIGNEAEAEAWASATGSPSLPRDLPAIARSIALLPKFNPSHPRIVIFTQGARETVMVTSDEPDIPQMFPVNRLRDNQIVDTNGAGDAFAGGFMGALVAGKSLPDSISVGHALAWACVQQASS